ncbi:hypothetical protein [Sphingobacterium griseoflavum]|uniref:Late embryogenesis abundant protein LEA-2 subgroup domain-containing protein n=1 Tax=Sphingobacterium griseoflavum TaxID=1474952 RepID=A0ABQ3HY17_9SPHI|nr:hypothetical protein [Sphingobacterium griseoflavum]GHE44984.1 hypothetical protein GCM10017764_30320 [Sphingobacterium griseoflavum]
MMKNKKLSLLCYALLIFLISGCAVTKNNIDALAKCDYSVESLQDVRLAGRAIDSYTAGNSVNIASLPAVALAMLRKDLPLEARVNMKISNPTSTRTSINSFKYLIEIQGKPLFEGDVNQNVQLATGESTTVPLSFKANIFGATQEKGLESVLNELFTREGEGFLVLKIKPSIRIGSSNIYYPGYITVDRNLAKSIRKLVM